MDVNLPVLLSAGLILLLLFFVGYIGMKIRIPGVILYIILGIILGGFLSDNKLLYVSGEIGIVLLFFMLGMEFPLSRLVGIAKRVAPAGFLDVFLNLGITMLICYFFGLDWLTSFLIGSVVYATSSSITAKLLESSKRMANTESEFMLGLLIFEDLVAPIAVAVLVGLTAGTSLSGFDFAIIFVKIIGLILGAVFIGQVIFRKLEHFVDKYLTEDIFILFIVGIALSYGGLALLLDLSEVLGAFLAGIILAEVRRTQNLEHVILPVRDLFLPLFFVYFGTTVAFGAGIPMAGLLIVLILWSIVAKILVGVIGGRMYGLSKKVSLRAGISLTQRGEFSVIIASLALDSIRLFSSLFILASALIGILLFQFAPKITKMIYPSTPKQMKYKVPH
ncbi:sodium:proton exchanger [Desulfuribacillus stibiiarsenatis]|uniref:Sodium:proton exchanger n=1 Tax=Desulfuribacillus stibiiarsenatis TaxID=1390249 RepID=A0A1E5L442_9FIRM|nr:cation:proton antiporter [Desulfuribacillus stibiiarsenatis]OEH84887.1 sodium:proton exchanger [Desulfuribacillus stibiiarsenatis]